MDSYEEIKAQVDKACEPLLRKLCISIALIKVGREKGYSLKQISDFSTPWGKAPESEEERFFQDLVWIHRVLPPHEKFDPVKAKVGYYSKFKKKVLADFWENFEETEEKKERHIPVNPSSLKPTLRSIRKKLAEKNSVN